MSGEISYHVNENLSPEEFIAVLKASTLAERRPVDNSDCIKGMVDNANLIVTARVDEKLIGVARSVTDFSYCCYLSDLAVDQSYQGRGIGKQLINITQEQLGQQCKIILLSAPATADYYPKLGLKKHPQAWLLHREQRVE